ncbi:phage head-tail connector protein [Sutcliffiella sp. NC1]|uniref:phage head-tail connector protein n=1 Tax=Sutcliffiella sp. NC1 TaxID=3004096 RepID=UPI0022DE16B4|nr:phage head-tail connector protein [Sutcliffiella sp. NC1]WBL16373.1 phage head-tail connector protein [Sutcliffiella sp. NC1]
MDSLAKLSKLLDEDDFEMLEIYLGRAQNHVKSYCNLSELNETQQEIAEDIAIFNYRNKGVENIVSEGKGSLSESYRNDLPPDLIRRLNQHRRMRFV